VSSTALGDQFVRGGSVDDQTPDGSDYRDNRVNYLTARRASATIDRRSYMRESNIVPALRCCRRSRAMLAARTAAVSLMALILLGLPTGSPRQSDALSPGDHRAVALRPDSSITLIALARLPRRSSFAPFAPWRSRLKSVLEETSHEFGDEIDFGPVAAPSRHSRSISVDSVSPRLPTARPMRC
jgi:hypothetical protein